MVATGQPRIPLFAFFFKRLRARSCIGISLTPVILYGQGFARPFDYCSAAASETTSSPCGVQTSVLAPANLSWAKLTSIASEKPSSSFSVKTPSLAPLWAFFVQIFAHGHGSPPSPLLPRARFSEECHTCTPLITTGLVCRSWHRRERWSMSKPAPA